MTYTVEQLAPGSYDVLLNASLIAALVRDADSGGSDDEWRIDLLDEVPASERPSPLYRSATPFGHTRLPSNGLASRSR